MGFSRGPSAVAHRHVTLRPPLQDQSGGGGSLGRTVNHSLQRSGGLRSRELERGGSVAEEEQLPHLPTFFCSFTNQAQLLQHPRPWRIAMHYHTNTPTHMSIFCAR